MSSITELRPVRVRLPDAVKAFQTPFLVAVAYFLAAHAAFWIGTLSDRIFAPVWPPNVVLFCALLLVPTRRWWLFIVAAFPAHILAEMSVGMPPAQMMVAFATNCMVATGSAIGVRRLLGGPPWFATLQDAATYILVTAVVSPGFSALGGAFVQILGGGRIDRYWWFWASWFISNALSSVTLAPVFLIFFTLDRDQFARMTRARRAEALILGLSLVAVCAVAFGASGGTMNSGFLPAMLYSPLPLILWAALRFGQRGASGAILVVTVVSISQSLHGSNVFITLDPERNVFALQVFLTGLAIPVFLLGAAIDELQGAGRRMRTLAGTLLRTQDEERRRIARELHDSTGQNLVVAGLIVDRVESMSPPAAGPAIKELTDLLQRSIREVRTVSYLLHPPLLDESGLGLALRSYVDGFSRRTGLRVSLDLPPELERLPADVELVLFRVVQEALSNVWRHSGSTTAQIRLMNRILRDKRHIVLTIEDAGKGMQADIRRSKLSGRELKDHAFSGLGISGMRERLRQIEGRLEIDSIVGKTTIKATLVVK